MTVLPPTGTALGNRELQILQLVAEGQSNAAIGAVLHISPMTVKSHLVRIGRKLGHGTKAGMVGVAFRRGVLR